MRQISSGKQQFDSIIENNCFYIDKTNFIKEWWEQNDEVSLITRPRRFGKTLNLHMIYCFFSNKYAGRSDLFEHLNIWKDEQLRKLQGTYPVLFLSFADVKEITFEDAKESIKKGIVDLYNENVFLLEEDVLSDNEKMQFLNINLNMSDAVAARAIRDLAGYLCRYYKKKVMILLDEYDTPLQEAYVNGYWKEMTNFTRSLFHATFKTNPHMERGLMTGITRISKASMFSDLNNLIVTTTTSNRYTDAFGFTEEEVFAALDEYHMSKKKEQVKTWYNGFVFGTRKDIYNPWSISNYLKEKELKPFWANTSSSNMASKLIQQGSKDIKLKMEQLINGETIEVELDEEIIFTQLDENEDAIWSLLLASGYLKVMEAPNYIDGEDGKYVLSLTNLEVKKMFTKMISMWFKGSATGYNDFVKALLLGDVDYMNEYMNRIAEATFSSFDTANQVSEHTQPERFYHGFVLGLIVDLWNQYRITSNRESGLGRYDVVMEPFDKSQNAYVLEFKVCNTRKEDSLEKTVQVALQQIREKNYDADLLARGFSKEKIKHYGFAFQGKQILIGE